jgi:prepilin-type N-terminal cleavage/methylation domain-containing protein
MDQQTYRSGFTLIELMIASAVLAVVSIFVGRALTDNERAYQTVDQAAESQQNLRAIVDILERDLRHAGMMLPETGSVCGNDSTSGPDTLYLADAAAIDVQDDFEGYDGALITAGTPGTGTITFTLSSLIMEPSPPTRAAYDTDGNGTADSDFRVGGGAIIFDGSDGARGTGCGRVTAVNLASDQITVAMVSVLDTGGAGPYMAIPANEYRINGSTLEWNSLPLASNIEDLQIAWIYDFDDDDILDANETLGAFGATAYDSDDEDASELREIRATVIARSRQEDQEFTRGRPQVAENRNGGAFTDDGFRRRYVTTQVRLRNVGQRQEI